MKSIKRNFLYHSFLKVTAVIFPLITAPYVSRVLEPDGVGLFGFASTYTAYFALFAVLGIPRYGIRMVAANRDNKEKLQTVVSELISLSFVATLIVCLLYIISLFVVREAHQNYLLFIVTGITLFMAPLNIEWVFSGLEEYGYITLRALIIRILSIAALFIFVKEKNDLIIYAGISSLSKVITDLWNLTKIVRMGIKPRLKICGLNKHLKQVLILFSANVAISIYTMLDTLMLGFFSNYEQVGFYSQTSHLSKTLLAIVTSLSAVAMPRMAYYKKNGNLKELNRLANKSMSFVSFFSIPMAFGIMCLSPTFVPLFFGEKFVGATIPLQIICFLVVAIGMNDITGTQILISLGKDKQFLYSVLAGTLSNFTLNLFLIPKWGAIGASIASVFAEFFILFVMLWFVYKYTPVRFHIKSDILKSFFGAALLVPIYFLVAQFAHGWMLVVVYPIIGALCYFVIQAIIKHSSYELFVSEVLKKFKINRLQNK